MAVRSTVQLGEPLLRTPCAEISDVGSGDVGELGVDLRDTLEDWVRRTSYGRGIAAPQIGAGVRVVYASLNEHQVMVNPKIIAYSHETWVPWETCLSFSVAFFFRARRSAWVDVTYQSLDGRSHELRADGGLGHLLQHEIDHLDGVVAIDRIVMLDTLCMRSEFELRHRDESPYRQ